MKTISKSKSMNRGIIQNFQLINMKKSIFLICFCAYSLSMSAQFLVQYMHVNPMKFSIQDFNQIKITNTGSKVEKATVIYILKDAKNNSICEIDFSVINLNPGVNQLNYSSGKISWSNTPYRDQLLRDQLVMGNFQVCVGVTDLTEVLPNANDCYDVELRSEEIENPLEVRPLELNSPDNKDTIEEKRPLLTWIPPSPVYQGTMYHLTLTEKKEKQTCIESLNNNVPIIDKKSIQTNILNYPVETPALTEGKTYCWRVAAYRNVKEYTRSEEWEFVEKKPVEVNISIPKIDDLQNTNSVLLTNTIRFLIDNRELEKPLEIKIEFNKDNQWVNINLKEKISLIYGLNTVEIPVEVIKQKGNYKISVFNINNKTYQWNVIIK